MRLTDLLTPEAIVSSLKSTSKKQALLELSEKASELSGRPAREIFDALLQRERLGSTGIGDGVAIPHGKLTKLKKIFGVFARTRATHRFRGAGWRPRRFGLFIDHTRKFRRRSFEGAGLRRSHAARSANRGDNSRHTRRQRALFGAGATFAAARGLTTTAVPPVSVGRGALRSNMRSVSALAARLRSQRMISREATLVGIDALPAFPSRLGGEFGVLREASFFVGNALPALAGDQPLLFWVHRGETADWICEVVELSSSVFSLRVDAACALISGGRTRFDAPTDRPRASPRRRRSRAPTPYTKG